LQVTDIKLNGARMVDPAATHAYLKRKLTLPDYYGANLDALWDCLTTDLTGKKIIIRNRDAIITNLGSYGEALLQVFQDAAEENERLRIEFQE
jgi:ribonuclease inhibitor